MVVPRYPNCPSAYRDHVTTLASAKTGVALHFRVPLLTLSQNRCSAFRVFFFATFW